MNIIVNKFLLAGGTFLPEVHLKQPTAPSISGFVYSACGRLTENIQGNRRFKISFSKQTR